MTRDLVIFFRQFATLIAAGIPIVNACTVLETTLPKPAMQKLIKTIKKDLKNGKALSGSLQHHPHHIDPLLLQLVRISEHTGKLDVMLQSIAQHLEKKLQFREQIHRALFYPCLVAIMGLLITLIMLTVIVPRFAELFPDVPNLPLLTRAIFLLSTLIRQYGWILPIVPLILYLLKRYQKFTLLTKLPFLKYYLRQIHLAYFTRNLGVTLGAGIPIGSALTLAIHPHSEVEFESAIKKLGRQVRSGMQLHRAMRLSPLFPPLLLQMTQTGEEAGQLENMLLKTADMLDSDIEHALNRFSQLLEPLIMVILGVLIGGLVTGIYLPIFKLGNII